MNYHMTAPPVSSQLPLDCSRLIVCETTGDWAAAIRRAIAESPKSDDLTGWVVEARGFPQLLAAAQTHPASLCVVEVTTDNAERAATVVEQLHVRFPNLNIIAAIASQPALVAEMILREAGATYVARSRRDADIIARIWQQHSKIHPPREETWRDQIFAQLPWFENPHSAFRTPQSHA